MTRQGATLAKLARPSGSDLIRRERLFAALDAARSGRIAWIAAPGGSGKTSLVASWIEVRKAPCIWMSVDAGDADPGSLFYYLAAGARQLGASGLPAFGAAARPQLGVFARRFGEQLFGAAPSGLVLVLDSYHVLPADAEIHEAIDALLESIPPGSCAVVASRARPPARLARWIADAGFRAIEWPELQLRPDESAALARLHGLKPGPATDAVCERAQGWAAGIVLLARSPAGQAPPPTVVSTQAVFDYFAIEVLARVPERTRQFLLRSAFLPRMAGALARAATGESEADGLLEALHRSHLFTQRCDAAEPTYDYHPLFRDFLQRHAAIEFDADALRAVRAASASALVGAGEGGAAAPLLVANENWPALARIVRACADEFAAHGRHAILAQWIEKVPPEVRAGEPWLAHWLGRCRLALRAPGARELLATAFDAFERAGDAEGAFSSCAWLLRSSATAEEAAHWVEAAERIAAAHPRLDDPRAEARLIAQFLLVHQFPPHHPLVERFAARAEHLARTLEGVAERTRMAAFAMNVSTMHADLRRLAALTAETHSLAARDDAPPADLAMLLLFRGYCQLQYDDDNAAATIARMEHLAAATGSPDVFIATGYLGYRAAVLAGDIGRARDCLERLRRAGGLPAPLAKHMGTLTCYLALLENDPARAVAEARAMLESAGGVMPGHRPMWRANLGQALLAQGETAAALEEIDCAIGTARTCRLDGILVAAQLLRAAALQQLGDAASADASLSEGLAGARSLGCVPHMPFILPGTLAQLAAVALDRGIERDFVRQTIARHGLAPPAAEEERWPWRVRVRAFGAFETAVDGEPLENGTKPQRRPVDLLKYVIAAGGRDVAFGAVTQALWPDAEGDAAKRSFDVTLHRLRRMLGRDDAIALQGGKLALNPGIVWVDALAFERLAGRLGEMQRGVRDGPLAPIELLERALRLYRGPLLSSDDEPWIRPARARLQRRFLQLAEAAGKHWERKGRPDAALAWYHRAVDLEPTAERIHQHILRLLHAQGRFAEALEAYRRCREMLAVVLAATPSPETEALHRLVRG
ncbi:MAG TPA: BTAD domain-containing putative transcriptional regulator [Burkholderiales bacterium]|nr:BTAD domain-containing putative transcriptional regulator [Burkholderiales bacterium]